MDMEPFEKFLIVNQLQVQRSSVMCVTCGGWLSPPVYVDECNHNYCGACSPATAIGIAKQRADVEDLLKTYKFPCCTPGCELFFSYDRLAEHVRICTVADDNIPCALCSTPCAPADYSQHLIKEHEATAIDAERANFDLPVLTTPLTTVQHYVVTLAGSVALCTCEQRTPTLLTVTLTNLTQSPLGNGRYTVSAQQIGSRNTATLYEAHVQRAIDVHIEEGQRYNLSVALGSSIQRALTLECPVCMHDFGPTMRQCAPNAHCLCVECGEKLNACPICRMPLHTAVFSVRSLLAGALWPCAYKTRGCRVYRAAGAAMAAHERTCDLRPVLCPECKRKGPYAELRAHLQKIHVVADNFSVVRMQGVDKRMAVYVWHANAVFMFLVEVVGKHVWLSCTADFDHGINDGVDVSRVWYEMHFVRDGSGPLAEHVVRGAITDDTEPSIIALNTVRKWLTPLEEIQLRLCCYVLDANQESSTSKRAVIECVQV